MKPVRTRTRFGAAAVVALVGLVGPAIALVRGPLRRDLPALPVALGVAAAALWGAAFALSLAAALVPRRGDVLPAPSRASRVAAAAMAALALFALFATVDVPGVSMLPAERGWTLFDSCLHCIGTIAKVAVVFLIVGLLALRRLVPVGGSRVGMALGAAGGAMGGLLLVFICPFASAAHVVGGHVVRHGAGGAGRRAADAGDRPPRSRWPCSRSRSRPLERRDRHRPRRRGARRFSCSRRPRTRPAPGARPRAPSRRRSGTCRPERRPAARAAVDEIVSVPGVTLMPPPNVDVAGAAATLAAAPPLSSSTP